VNPAYFEVRFRTGEPIVPWPREFAIITAFATTGESWPREENEAADRELESELATRGVWFARVTGYSPASGHAEPGWAAELPIDDARRVGRRFRQDAIYLVRGDELSVTRCDDGQALAPVGRFRERVTGPGPG